MSTLAKSAVEYFNYLKWSEPQFYLKNGTSSYDVSCVTMLGNQFGTEPPTNSSFFAILFITLRSPIYIMTSTNAAQYVSEAGSTTL